MSLCVSLASRRLDPAERDRAGVPVEQREAVEEERRGERPQQEVLDRGFLAEQPTSAGQAAQQVQRERQDLERDEQDQQVVGRGEQHHAGDREHHQREDLGLLAAARWSRAAPRSTPASSRPARRTRRRPCSGDRSATSSTLPMPRTAIVPCRNSVGPSTLMAPSAVTVCVPASTTTAIRAPTQAEQRGDRDLRDPAATARHERLDEDADQRRDRRDQDRRERAVRDRRGLEGRSLAAPVVAARGRE